jgi:hypothetical protein
LICADPVRRLLLPFSRELSTFSVRGSAPTTITEEIALVTDISGVCSAGVTDHTTK